MVLLVAGVIGGAAAEPLQLKLLTPSVQDRGQGWLQVGVTDAAGQPAPDATVWLKSANAPDGSALASDVQLWLNDDKSFGMDLGKLNPQPGLYTLTMTAQKAGETTTAQARVAWTTEVEVVGVKAGVETGSSVDAQELSYPKQLPTTLSLVTDGASKVVVEFSVRRGPNSAAAGEVFRPHQAFVRAVHVGTGAAATFRSKAGAAGVHRAAFSAAEVAVQADGRGGLYELALLVGDAAVANPIDWRLGQVDVPAGRADAVAAPAGAKPEIRHQFRAPEKHPLALIPVAFAALQVALFLGLVWAMVSGKGLGVRFRGLPNTAGGAVAALGFHGGLFGILALYLLFWLRLSLLQLIPLLAVAGLVTAVFGYALLSHLASRAAA